MGVVEELGKECLEEREAKFCWDKGEVREGKDPGYI